MDTETIGTIYAGATIMLVCLSIVCWYIFPTLWIYNFIDKRKDIDPIHLYTILLSRLFFDSLLLFISIAVYQGHI